MTKGLYIHIPFCKSKCPYCDFTSYTGLKSLENDYIDAVLKEAGTYRGSKISTIYLGGGTPSVLSVDALFRLIHGIYDIFNVEKIGEFTIELNPKTVDAEIFKHYRNLGINRVSIGVQSFNPKNLRTLGRLHTPEDAKNAVLWAKMQGFENISIDLMFSVPNQTIAEVKADALTAAELGVSHISCYGLKIEPGTVFHKKGVTCLDDETDRAMYGAIGEVLQEKGFLKYEISNFAKPGKKSQHNLIYWTCGEYIGLGCGAHSYVDGKRFANTADIRKYISGSEYENMCVLSEHDMAVEKLIMGMRLTAGADKSLINALGTQEILEKYIDSGYIIEENNKIKFTDKGFDVSNYILSELI